MIKKILLYINILWIDSHSYSLLDPTIGQQTQKIPSLQALSTKHLFLFNNENQKEKLNFKLKTNPIFREQLKFDGLVIEHLDLSDLCLKDIDFRQCVFKYVNFNGSDLRGCNFDKCELERCNLKDAILYCSSDVAEEKISIEGFKITDWDHLALIKLYSSLIKESKLKQEDHITNEALAKSRCLNKFFPRLKLNLYYQNLSNLDLTDINLENANLSYARLQNTRLSNEVEIPKDLEDDRNQLFNKWIEGNPEEQEAYQKLANARFDLVSGVEPTQLIKGIEKKKKNLRNVNLHSVHLQGANLSKANLQNANLSYADLQGANLNKVNLQNANLSYADLQGANLREVNLQNVNLHSVHLQGANLSKANLQNANLTNAHLQGANLKEANLQNAMLSGAKLNGTDLRGANLKKINLWGTDLLGIQLQEADLREANLRGVSFVGAYIQRANLKGAIVYEAKLSKSFKLSPKCKDKNLMKIYQDCKDQRAKTLLKDILKAKDLWIEQTQ